MTNYIATFFTHFDAIRFSRDLRNEAVDASPAPVPRELSSSCGTCVKFTLEDGRDPQSLPNLGDVETLFSVSESDSYRLLLDQR